MTSILGTKTLPYIEIMSLLKIVKFHRMDANKKKIVF